MFFINMLSIGGKYFTIDLKVPCLIKRDDNQTDCAAIVCETDFLPW